jgi:hypothetical protein
MATLKELWTKQTENAKKNLDFAVKMKKRYPTDKDWITIEKTAKKLYKESLEKLKQY